jgi:DNA polymerase III epsilon subunit-like protein
MKPVPLNGNVDKKYLKKERVNRTRKKRSTVLSGSSIESSQIVALDCEFVGVGPQKTNALGRCSIVSYTGDIICDIYVLPDEPITDYRTPWSGIRPHDLVNAIPYECARNIIKAILKDKLVVGHALVNDLTVLRLEHLLKSNMIRDTSELFVLKQLAGLSHRQCVSLKALTSAILGRQIQVCEHDSVEDARAAMDLYRHIELDFEANLSKELSGIKRQRLLSETTSYLADSYWPDDLLTK